MNLPYHLNSYRKELDSLSNQAKSILEFVIENNDVNKFLERIEKEPNLERKTVMILTQDILRGYHNTIYSYSWPYEKELKFWNLVNSKCKDEYKIYFILANFQREKKSIDELKELYFKAFNQHLDHIFSLEDSDIEEFYNNKSTRYDFLRLEFKARITQWEDFEDNWNNGYPWIKKFGSDNKAMEIINQMLKERKKKLN